MDIKKRWKRGIAIVMLAVLLALYILLLSSRKHGQEMYRRQNLKSMRITILQTIGGVPSSLPPPVIFPISQNKPLFVNLTTLPSNASRWETAHLIHTNYPWKVVVPPPSENTSHRLTLETTLQQAQRHHCNVAAANGGPFNAHGWSTGPTVMNQQLVRTSNESLLDTTFVGFGTTTENQWVLGNYRQLQDAFVSIDNFCTGFGWLVYHGKMVANNSVNPTGAIRAPRTAIGLDCDGNLMLLVVDGCEKW
jgi:Phosphodiester glycosidase